MSTADFGTKVRGIILNRAEGRCEGCMKAGVPLELHHRQYKSRGGLGTVANALALCGRGNTDGCHGVAHSGEGERRGWSIRSGFDPRTWPAVRFLPDRAGLYRMAWVEFNQIGLFVEITAEEASRRMGRESA